MVGAGGHARACIDVIEQERRFAVAGLVGLPQEVGTKVLGYSVLGTDIDLPALLGRCRHAIVAAGQIRDHKVRMQLFDIVRNAGYALPTIRSPHAYVSPHAILGDGTIVMHGAIVNAGAVVGRNCIINSQALVEHDCAIGDHCHISTAATVNGGVRVGTGSFIGSNSTVRQCVTIGDGSVIGMGQHVFSDCEPCTVMPPTKRAS